MMLYHGTNIDIQSIDLALCRPYKDFGTGIENGKACCKDLWWNSGYQYV